MVNPVRFHMGIIHRVKKVSNILDTIKEIPLGNSNRVKENRMGLTVLEMEVRNPANPDITKKEFLIDSGAIYSVVPATIANGSCSALFVRIGIQEL